MIMLKPHMKYLLISTPFLITAYTFIDDSYVGRDDIIFNTVSNFIGIALLNMLVFFYYHKPIYTTIQ